MGHGARGAVLMANPRARKRQRAESREPWVPLTRATDPTTGKHRVLIAGREVQIFKNHRYTVQVRELDPVRPDVLPAMEISVRRNDRQPVTDWRDLQRIKNEMAGPECEGVQLFPAETRLVDTANQFYMYAILDPRFRFPFGFRERMVSDVSSHGAV